MALRSEQARVLRRRVLGGLLRNLALFTGTFIALCLAMETFVVPGLADYVADSTSSWRTPDCSEQFDQIMVEEGLQGNDIFVGYENEMASLGYSTQPGSYLEISAELDSFEQLIQEEAAAQGGNEAAMLDKMIADAENEEAADEAISEGKGNASVAGADPYVDSGDGNAAEGSGSDAVTPVPFIGYRQVLAAEGVNPDDASAAQAMAALRICASIQELGLSLSVPSPYLSQSATEDDALRLLASAAMMGFDQASFEKILAEAYRTSQTRAYDAWLDLPAAEQARALGINDEHPVWQIEQSAEGVFSIRDVATYTFIKSFKLPLAALVFVAGWLIIIFWALNKSLRYFDDLSGAVGALLADKNAPIELPADLSIARSELAVMRSQSLADERAAHAAEQRKNELVAYLAHDIRTPLTSVLGYLDLLRETTDLPRDTLRKYADIAYTKAERLESLINEFFEITRYNLSAIPIERETIGVRLFCQQVAEAFFPEAAARNIRITIDVDGRDQFFVDPDKLARALGNVLRNAVAYADANSTIALAARQDARTTTITVANRGREISKAHLESIFEKFYREDGARTSRSGGAGLGLAIAREIVVAHHGDIEAASERGITVFTLRIPTHGEGGAGEAPAAPTAAAPRTAPRALRPSRSGGRTAQMPTQGRMDEAPSTAQQSTTAPAGTPRPARRAGTATPGAPAAAGARSAGERPAARRQGASPLNPRNARHGHVPPRGAVRDNDPEPRRRGLPR